MITTKALRFVKLNIIMQPLLLVLGIASSIIAVRMLGSNIYAHIVLLNGFMGTIGFLLSLGTLATITKMWIDSEDPIAKQAIVVISFLIQIVLILLFVGTISVFPEILNAVLGDFKDFISTFDITLILISTVLSLIGTPILTAELENKILLGSSFFNTISNAIWIIVVSFLSIDLHYIIDIIILINFFTSLIIFIGASQYFGKFQIKKCFLQINQVLVIRYMKFFTAISFVRLLVYTVSLPFLSLVLNHFSMYTELVSLSIIYKVLNMVSTVYNIPITGVGGVLFLKAFKNNNLDFANKIYQVIVKYLTFFYALTVIAFMFSLHDLLQLVYKVTIDPLIVNIFLFNMLFTGIFIPSNWIITSKESYKVIYISSIVSTTIFQMILWLYVKDYGLSAIAWATLGNSILYGGIGLAFVLSQHHEISFPKSFFRTVFIAISAGAIIGYGINFHIAATIIAISIFIGITVVFIQFSQNEKDLIFKVLHPKLHGVLRVVLK